MATDVSGNGTETGDSNTENDLMFVKVVAMVVLGVASLLLGILPSRVTKWVHPGNGSVAAGKKRIQEKVISMLLCFGAGVLLYTTFMHLQPEVRKGFESLNEAGRLPFVKKTGIQIAELVFCAGFFLVYFVEELVHLFLHHQHDNQAETVSVPRRTISLRRWSARHLLDAGEDHANIGSNTINLRSALTASAPTKPEGNQNGSIPSEKVKTDSKSEKCPSPKTKKIVISEQQISTIAASLDSRGNGHHAKHHGHSHLPATHFSLDEESGVVAKVVANSVRGLITIIALSFHEVFEGLAVGLESNIGNVWYLFAAIATHKFVIAFCVGVELVSSKTRPLLFFLYMVTFAAATPIGIGVGLALSMSGGGEDSAEGLAATVLQGMAAGTLVYVVFFEILQRERSGEHSGPCQLLAVFTGFAIMFGLTMLMGHHHSHDHGHSSEAGHGHEHGHGHGHEHGHDHGVTTLAPTAEDLLVRLLNSSILGI